MKKLNKPYIDDMLECINYIQEWTAKMTFAQFENNKMTQAAVFRNIEIIGEAAKRLSDDFVEKYSELEIHQARGMRNHLIHKYDDVDIERVWDVVKNDLPRLKKQLQEILKTKID
jgi:uncharacterized protein with HEPN domain